MTAGSSLTPGVHVTDARVLAVEEQRSSSQERDKEHGDGFQT